ncbi:ABC transporter substrate-binding protein [Paenibacillus validus]|uniref:ABC transporter substrate-binding protein n=1 Tax=Paenibacillus validus TaxID=44253 RepID=A0A7X2Z805_9BACL|nr:MULTISPECIES: ABC transporter substrate-binding protein [Paenibacillus]MED4602847.1 ABC transporter substrate-binding protein [Paenibacillus validus]MED4607311.1 ABC transporter substrate-binding protein [Paenibacillus validus]MUG69368.1 ABC transporter substrate-binding protein [Paenibacillus validus]
MSFGKKVVRLAAIASLVISVLSACGSADTKPASAPSANQEKTATAKPIKIGFLVPKTGKGKDYGEKEEIATKIAVDEINAAGGINGSKLELVTEDTAGDNKQAVLLTRKLEKENVVAISGPHFSGEAEVTFPIANELKIPIISYASAKPGISAANRPWAFRNSMTDDKLLSTALPVFAKHYNVKKFAVIYDEKDAVSKSAGVDVLPVAIEKNGFEWVNKSNPLAIKTGDTDYSAIVTKVKGMKPEAIAVSVLYQEGAGLVKELRRQGVNVPIIGTVGIYASAFPKLAGEAAKDIVVGTYWYPEIDRAQAQEFLKKFEPEAVKLTPDASKPDPYAVNAYDNIQIIAKQLKDAGLNGDSDVKKLRETVRSGWEKLKDYEGTQGKMTIDAEGDGVKEVHTVTIKDGNYAPLK